MSAIAKIVVKVGTNVIARKDGLLNITNISHLVDQIAALKREGHAVILVSSGAVGAGRSMITVPEDLSKVVRRQVLSAIGQVRLMELYRQLFANHHLFCAQVLATKDDFKGRQHYINMKNCFQALLRDQVVPVVNENDVVSVSELMFTDNDELAGLVAAMINADKLIILSSVDGVLDGSPDHPESRVVSEIHPDDKQILQLISPSKSSFGRGGMMTKLRIAQKAAKVGIDTYIANGNRPNVLLDVVAGRGLFTRFAATEKISDFKKWMAYNFEENKGAVTINEGAEQALRSSISSLLPVGILEVSGDFEKGDIIRILNAQGQAIGQGIAQYQAATARQYAGLKNQKPLIHYDYLLMEKA